MPDDFFSAHAWDVISHILEALVVIFGVVKGLRKALEEKVDVAAAKAASGVVDPISKRLAEHEALDDRRHQENVGRLDSLDRGQHAILGRLEHRR